MCQGIYSFFFISLKLIIIASVWTHGSVPRKIIKPNLLQEVLIQSLKKDLWQADNIQLNFSKTPFMKTTLRPVISQTPRLTASLRYCWFLPSAAKHLLTILYTNISQLSTTYPALGTSDSKTNIYNIHSGLSFIPFYQQLYFQ